MQLALAAHTSTAMDVASTSDPDPTTAFVAAMNAVLAANNAAGVTVDNHERLIDVHQIVSEHRYRAPAAVTGHAARLLDDVDDERLYGLLHDNVHLMQLLHAHDLVASGAYEPQLPTIAHEVDEDDGCAIKIVRLVRNAPNESLGATIKCEADGTVLIARVMNGGVAHRSASIQVGDECLEVNGVCVTGKDAGDIVALLASNAQCVTFKLLPAAVDANANGDTHDEHVFVRALFAYTPAADDEHPCHQAGLSFAAGDILQLVEHGDADDWWQATSEHTAYIIPSARTMCRRGTSDAYERVAHMPPRAHRPIVLVGPPGVGRNELQRRLIALNGARFATTVPYTSRVRKPTELAGRDYEFVTRAQMETWIKASAFIEYGEYKGNLYGTLLASVHAIMAEGRTAVLTPHPQALKMLRQPSLKPYIVFVKPPPFAALKQTRGEHARHFSDDELLAIIHNAQQLKQNYGKWFDYTLVNGSLEFAFRELCDALQRLDERPTWVPCTWLD